MLFIDRDASTVTLAGRRFPAVALICPPTDDWPEEPDSDRTLGAGGGDQSVYVPAENGVLFSIEEARNEKYHGLSFGLAARTCRRVWSVDEWLWLPWNVGLVDGHLVPGARPSDWSWAEPEWVVETIDRVSRKPFTQPDGPPHQLVRLNHFEETADAW